MPLTIAQSDDPGPLDRQLVAGRITTHYRAMAAAADVHADWGQLDIRITDPPHVAGITTRIGRRSYPTALRALVDPSKRFAVGGMLTARAVHLAQRFIISAMRDYETAPPDDHSPASGPPGGHDDAAER